MKWLSHVQLFATLWTVAHQAPPSMGFSRQEYWSELLFPSPMDGCIVSSNFLLNNGAVNITISWCTCAKVSLEYKY